MSYKISVPIINATVERNGRDKMAENLRELDAERVFLALDCYLPHKEERDEAIAALKENCEYFHSRGFEVGAWIWAFMFRDPVEYNRLTMVNEEFIEESNFACPLDPDFLKFSGEYIADIAASGVDLIMFDDDLRFGPIHHGNMGCLCSLHRKMICEKVGEELSREELARRILSGGENKYRTAWLECNGHSLEAFCENARKYVDTVEPKIRLGYCACLTGWDVDGTDLDRMTHAMSPNTKPFARLSGAPYWAYARAWDNRLQYVIELERMECSWIKDKGIEVFAEGDSYPRPRIKCPASYLEGFDTAIRAAGCTDGILKYGIDYTSSTEYERGYTEFHKRNKPLYSEIDRAFGAKKPCGIRIYEAQNKVKRADLDAFHPAYMGAQYFFFSYAARFLSVQAIPTVYEGDGVCGIAFGENVKYLNSEERCRGLIIDGSGAQMLHSMGVDVGIETLGKKQRTVTELVTENGEHLSTFGAEAYANSFKESIKILSIGQQGGGIALMGNDSGQDDVPLSYLYENADGERYLVFNVDANNCLNKRSHDFFTQQIRGKQVADSVNWLTRGGSLPAYSYGNPFLYMIAKEEEGKLSVGLWNFFEDTIFEPKVKIGGEYKDIRVLGGGRGSLDGDTVSLGEISAFGFAAFELTK